MKTPTPQCCDLCQGLEPTKDFYGVVTYCKDVSCVCHTELCHTKFCECTPTVQNLFLFGGSVRCRNCNLPIRPTTGEVKSEICSKHGVVHRNGGYPSCPTNQPTEDVEKRFEDKASELQNLLWKAVSGVNDEPFNTRLNVQYDVLYRYLETELSQARTEERLRIVAKAQELGYIIGFREGDAFKECVWSDLIEHI